MTYRPAAAGSGARRTACPRCRRPVLRQLVGRRAALDVTADADLMPPAAAASLTGPNRLAWCARRSGAEVDLRWVLSSHPATCPHPHVIDHACTARAAPARPAPRRTTRTTTPVPDGQLTL